MMKSKNNWQGNENDVIDNDIVLDPEPTVEPTAEEIAAAQTEENNRAAAENAAVTKQAAEEAERAAKQQAEDDKNAAIKAAEDAKIAADKAIADQKSTDEILNRDQEARQVLDAKIDRYLVIYNAIAAKITSEHAIAAIFAAVVAEK